ncbi:hypothetical protein D3C76_1021240 [compost metagenome]
MRLELEKVGGSMKIKSNSSRHACSQAMTSPCSRRFLSEKPLSDRLRRAQSRYVRDRSTLVVLRAPPLAACTLAVAV